MRMALGFVMLVIVGCTVQASPPSKSPDALDRCIQAIVNDLAAPAHHNPFFPHPVREACDPYLAEHFEPTPTVLPGALR